ncbi:MAG: hypothetical protein RIR09_658 [Pseudomonadota bacterium]
MSLITQCPACTTLFKVVPDQLRISDGWVRCGQCDEVFDANAHLQVSTPAPAPAAPTNNLPDAAEPPVAPEDTPLEESLASPPQASIEPSVAVPDAALSAHWTDEETPPPTEEEMHAWVLAAVAAEASDLKAQSSALMDAMPRYLEVPPPTPEPQNADDSASAPEPATARQSQMDDDDALDAQEEDAPLLSFMKPVRMPAARSSRPVRVAMLAASALLVATLILQILVQQRDWLAAKAPATRPMLAELCGLLGCQVLPLREIEAIVIDSSAFVKIRPNAYRVHFTLKNTAVYAVGTPSLELTLTNTGDQAIVRRIFSPQEFGIQDATLGPGAEMNAVVSIGVELADKTERVSGYRLLVFYP